MHAKVYTHTHWSRLDIVCLYNNFPEMGGMGGKFKYLTEMKVYSAYNFIGKCVHRYFRKIILFYVYLFCDFVFSN